jgi:hypothetical protein
MAIIHLVMKNLFLFLMLLVVFTFIQSKSTARTYHGEPDELLRTARNLFYASVEDESSLNKALTAFRRLAKFGGKWKAKATTYIGALYALQGKHAFWPHKKLEYVNKGLDVMDRGLKMNPLDIESLFVHASTCYYLPFFFDRADEAENNFQRIVDLLPSKSAEYDSTLVVNAAAFILENITLDSAERRMLETHNLQAVR